MTQCMVTGRMDEAKKTAANRILRREGLNASAAINLMYDRIIEQGSADFLGLVESAPSSDDWKAAAAFVDSLSSKRKSRFDGMTDAEIRTDRLRKRGLLS